MMTDVKGIQIAWALAVLFEDECEAFDRTLPGIEGRDGWIPLPHYLGECNRWGLDPREVRREVNGLRFPPRADELEAARRILGISGEAPTWQ